jgi:hypothetical protein
MVNMTVNVIATFGIGEGNLDKEATSHDDLFDGFRMSLQYWY